MFLKSERLYDKPANPKGGGPYYLYSVNPHYVADSKQTRSSLPKQHPLMSAFYGI
jgi:predicted transcriptional regulator